MSVHGRDAGVLARLAAAEQERDLVEEVVAQMDLGPGRRDDRAAVVGGAVVDGRAPGV